MEKRLLLAFVLSAVLFAVWAVLFPPPRPTRPEGLEPAADGGGGTVTAATPIPEAFSEGPAAGAEAGEPIVEAVEGGSEERVRLVNDELALEVSNRGAAITSMVLRGFLGDQGEPLELVQTVAHPQRALPLQLVCADGVDERLYRAEPTARGVRYVWSDGRGAVVEKELELPVSGYGIRVSVTTRGGSRGCGLSVGTGMRDTSVAEQENRFASWGDATIGVGGKVEKIVRDKLKEAETFPGETVAFAGFSDTYFLSLLRPRSAVDSVVVSPLEYRSLTGTGEQEVQKVLRVTVELEGGSIEGELFSAPKEYDLLQAIGGGVERTLDFGWFHLISVAFLKALRWIHGWAGNWGVAIVLLTLGIRILLFPLMHTSTVSMRKMAKLQPKVKVLQEKYKKQKGDPKARAKMNQEMMDLYRVEGVNPMGGCLPMLVQLPILWALYTLFAYAIELRHAPFVLWIDDLSARDPYYVTPILMTATMWLQQRLAPPVGDPQQQKIFRWMPLIFGVMFMGFPSGLVLYWLANNVITIIQQEVTLRMIGERRSR